MSERPVLLLVPVKDAPNTKTRLDDASTVRRRALMRAFARDAIETAARSRFARVVVVGDPRAAGDGVTVLPDDGHGDLNTALRASAGRLGTVGPIAVMLADLPCLTLTDLDAALRIALERGGRSFVRDAAGTGTTLLVAADGPLEPHFGPGSADRHLASGAHPITASIPTLRLDVDTPDDLRRAIELGVGPATRAALARLTLTPNDDPAAPSHEDAAGDRSNAT